jgi:HAD superfamily hydrolase (TIGR01549 family)
LNEVGTRVDTRLGLNEDAVGNAGLTWRYGMSKQERSMKDRSMIFWDFDGVIKESVTVKTNAYVGLFRQFGPDVAERVRRHHEANGGMSRFEKIPLYLEWAGHSAKPDEIGRYCDMFASAVRQAVVDSSWVCGVREYLEANHARQHFVLVSATPQEEMEQILRDLGIYDWFREVHGSPTRKEDAIAAALERWNCRPADALVVGDSRSDYAAASNCRVEFLLRRTVLNIELQREFTGAQCEDFRNG